ncbi:MULTISPECIES: stage V sporulation protein AA [Bacillus]|uniref:stage V sporulation protein AA n=1 Tax=Bacillus TaxID=1386 RepID=UPI0002ED026E|nr:MULTISPECIES: stage V sporulation protein AA [Bacillus]
MEQIIYLRMRNRIKVNGGQQIFIKDVAKIIGPKEKLLAIGDIHLYEITKKDRNIVIIDFIQVIEKILEVYPQLEVQGIGTAQSIIEVKVKKRNFDVIFFILVWLLLFIGAALTIMNFHEDVSMPAVHKKLYTLLTGKVVEKPLILQIPYSLGLGVGMILFFNHFFKKRFNEEPSPLEVEMFNYQQDLDQYVMMNENKESMVEIDDHSNR